MIHFRKLLSTKIITVMTILDGGLLRKLFYHLENLATAKDNYKH